MRASVLYRMANGEEATRRQAAQAAGRPPTRRPASHATGMVATLTTPDNARTA